MRTCSNWHKSNVTWRVSVNLEMKENFYFIKTFLFLQIPWIHKKKKITYRCTHCNRSPVIEQCLLRLSGYSLLPKRVQILIMGFIYFLLDGVNPRNYLRRLPRIDVLQASLTNFNCLHSEFGYHLLPNFSVMSKRK